MTRALKVNIGRQGARPRRAPGPEPDAGGAHPASAPPSSRSGARPSSARSTRCAPWARSSRAVGSSLDLGEVLNTISAHAAPAVELRCLRHLRAGRASVASFVVVASYELGPDFAGRPPGSVRRRRTPRRGAARSGRPWSAAEARPDSRHRRGRRTLRWAALVPAGRLPRAARRADGQRRRAPAPWSCTARSPGRFDDRTVDLLTTLANQSQVAIDNARLFEELEDKSRAARGWPAATSPTSSPT